ncbi:Methyltransferase FkbM domain-containing protein [Caenorhabditis elegans]|uniref:Methyltransferase FkbM domain-containing protein n=1 Tax=Caenorhabditis elegans TaxID=6239 RepID=Q9XXL6_CAEEL|nr:Methyltransferase FkbM domain-containing protein [Caenorhabditis elegans]CAA18370.1 Methyltransferase FkbM domain-containing protein [Caenorhabditis elegans]|eukprot:NP_492928.1 Uncharacterized protein CELE_ZK1025.3 [Caenorhabditis elegans]
MLPYSRFDKLRLTERLPMRSLPRLILFGALVFVVFMLYSNYNDKKPLKEENELNVFKWAPPPVRHDTARNLTSYKSSPLFDAYYNCVYPKLRPLKGKYVEFFDEFSSLTEECDNLKAYNALDIRHVYNKDETKYIALPRNQSQLLTMVTLGIGHDIMGEISLKELHPNTQFYGADPSPEVNKILYEDKLGGKYYRYAVSGETGVQKSSIYTEQKEELAYRTETTEHIAVDYFFKYILNKSLIDILWIDVEQNEFPIMEQLHRNGAIDNAGVTICQMNIEVHSGVFEQPIGEKQMFHDFVWRVLEDRRYIMLRSYYADPFIRTFMINVGDEECRNPLLE